MRNATRFTRAQARILAAAILAYTAAYIGRTNLSMALGDLIASLRLTNAQGGMLPTAFSVAYAVGQVINGVIVDRVEPRGWIAAGLAGSAVCNLLLALSADYRPLVLIWGLNGLFQSMLWAPIVAVVAVNFDSGRHERASFLLSLTLVFGYLIAWSLSGLLTARLNWRWAFGVPAGVVLLVAGAVLWMLRGPDVGVGRARAARSAGPDRAQFKAYLLKTGLPAAFLGAACMGFIRDGVMNWAPTIVTQALGVDLNSAWGAMLVIPAVNSLGILFGRWVYRLSGHGVRKSLCALMLCAAAAALPLPACGRSAMACTLLMAACAAAMYGANPIVTTLLPIENARLGWAGTTSGLVDASIYAGGSLAGALAGAVSERAGWNAVFVMWTGAAFLGALAFAASARGRRRGRLLTDPMRVKTIVEE